MKHWQFDDWLAVAFMAAELEQSRPDMYQPA
jgi:hypothetical protein